MSRKRIKFKGNKDNVVAIKQPNIFQRFGHNVTEKFFAADQVVSDAMRQAATKVGSGFKAGAVATKGFCLNLTNKGKQLIERVAQGEKLAEECENLAIICRDAADRSDLVETAKLLRAQADKLEAIAKG